MDDIHSYLKANPERAAYFAQGWEELLAEYPQLTSHQTQAEWDQFRREHTGLNLDENLWLYGPASLEDDIQELIQKQAEEELVDEKKKPDEKQKQQQAGMHTISGYLIQKDAENKDKPLFETTITVTDIATKKKLQTLLSDSRGYFKTGFLLPYKRYLLVFRHPVLGNKEKKRVVNMKAFQPPLRIILSSAAQKPEQAQQEQTVTVPLSETPAATITAPVTNESGQPSDTIPFTERAGLSPELPQAPSQSVPKIPRLKVASSTSSQAPQLPTPTLSQSERPEPAEIQTVKLKIRQLTNNDPLVLKAQRQKDNRYTQIWKQRNEGITAAQWDNFIRQYPDLARKYLAYGPIAQAFARQQKSTTAQKSASETTPSLKKPYIPFTREGWYQQLQGKDTEVASTTIESSDISPLSEPATNDAEEVSPSPYIQRMSPTGSGAPPYPAQGDTIPSEDQGDEGGQPPRPPRRPRVRRPSFGGGRGGLGGLGRLGGLGGRGGGLLLRGATAAAPLFANPITWIILGIILLLIIILLLLGFEDPNQEATVTLTKTGPDQVGNEEEINYELRVTYSNASQVIVTDKIPENTDFVRAGGPGNPTYDPTTRTVTWTLTGLGGSSGSGNTSVGENLPPNKDTCGGVYNLSSNNQDQQNYGDPGCTLASSPRVSYSFQGKTWNNVPQALIDLLQQLDPENVGYWIGIAACEAPGFDPNNVTFFVGSTPTPDSGGAWGLFQMGRSTSGPYQPGNGLNGQYDRGDVNWQNQVSNAINDNEKRVIPAGNPPFRYYQCARDVFGLW